jgi:polysaccharide pyruvyl transferase WcaK-like protein
VKILVGGASTYGVKNAGDDAMFSVLCDGLRDRINNLEINFLARHLDKTFDKTFGVKSIKNVDHYSKKESVGRWFYGFNPNDDQNHLIKIRKTLEESEFVVIGGNSFMEVSKNEFMHGVTSYSALFGLLSTFFQKPYALYGVNGHPLKNDSTKQMARFLCNNAKVVTIREEFFKNELIQAGVNNQKLKVFADPAFGIEPVKTQKIGNSLLKNEKISLSSKKVIGICFRHMYWMWTEKQYAFYANKMAKICDDLIKTYSADILFIPNCTYAEGNRYQDDRIVSKDIIKKMKNKKNAFLINHDLHLFDRLALFPLLDLVITNRRHVSIFSAIHNIPFISISTGHLWHFEPLMNALNTKNQLIDFENDSLSKIQNKISKVWQEKLKISTSLEKNIPKLQNKAKQQVDLIVDTLLNK